MIGRYFDGMSPAEIARERNLRPELVRQHIHRALAKLRTRLDRDFGDRRAWSTAVMGLYRGHAATVGTLLGFTAMKKLAVGVSLVNHGCPVHPGPSTRSRQGGSLTWPRPLPLRALWYAQPRLPP